MTEVEYAESTTHAGPELYQGLIEAQEAIDSVAPDRWTSGGARYHYASTEAILFDGRKALHKGGLALVRGRVKRYPRSEDGKDSFMVVTHFRLIHSSGQYLDFSIGIPAVPNRGMGDDKATGSAITYATRYAMVGMLCLPRTEKGEDPEERNDEQSGQQDRQPPAPQMRPPQARQESTNPAPKPFQRNSTSWDLEASLKVIRLWWNLTAQLGQQPPETDLDELAKHGLDEIRVAGQKAKQGLIEAMLRMEDSLRESGIEPDNRPLKTNDLSKLSNTHLTEYAKQLRVVGDLTFGKQNGEEEQE